MAKTEHTPTPWRIEAVARGAFSILAGNQPTAIAETYEPNQSMRVWTGADDPRANAAFIVRAVNAHDALVEALSELLANHVALVECGDCGNWDVETEKEVIQARAALSLAKGA